MSLRINPDWTQNILSALDLTKQAQEQALAQLSSGRRVNTLSDDPSAAAAYVQNQTAFAAEDQFVRNISSVQGQLQASEGALNGAVNALTQAITLGTQGATGTLSDADRSTIAQQLQDIRDQLLSLANTSYQGNYLFAGTKVMTQPFVLDANVPSGVRYDGNANANTVEISNGQTLSVQLPGSQIFSNPQGDVFQALHDLTNAIASNNTTQAGALVTQLRQSLDQVTSQRALIGNGLSRLDSTESFLNQDKINLQTQENQLVGADMSVVATNLSNATIARNAVLAASAQIAKLSLLDYLK
jgi:flagellar hook-associated protein 3 FlgL